MYNMNIDKMRVVKSYNVYLISILILGLLSEVHCTVSGSFVPIRDIDCLIFHKGELTTGRRESPIQQLIYNGGSGTYLINDPDSITCEKKWDGTNVIWKCEASLDEGIELGKTQVNCEGYEYPEDPNILSGSCSLSYSLIDTTNQKNNVEFWMIVLTIIIWTALYILVCLPNPLSYSRNDNSGFLPGAALGYGVGSSFGPRYGARYNSLHSYNGGKGGKHISVSYSKTSRR